MSLFRPSLRAAVMAVLCLLTLLVAPAGMAQSIANTAQVSWQQGGQTVSASSNLISFTTVTTPASISTYTVGQGVTTSLSYTPAQCGGAALTPSTAGASLQSASVTQSSSVQIGNVFYFRIMAAQANINANAIDKLQATLTTSSGDKETVTVFETGVNTGIFVGAMPTVGTPPAAVQGDCKLSLVANDTITISATLPGQQAVIATAQLQALADSYGYVFDSDDGSAVNGATVTLINVATGAPAQVFAPDGVTAWPSTVVTGQNVQDAAGNSYTLQAGEYRFPVVQPGQYRLQITPPSPYSAPSTVTAAHLAGMTRPDGSPVVITTGSYGAAFTVASPQSLRIDIPVDKPAIAVTLSKTASRVTAQAGDVVFYTLTVANPENTIKRNVVVVDKPARQLRIRPQTVRIDGSAAPGAVSFSADGSTMTVQIATIAPSSSHIITYAASVQPNATPGQAANTATATDSRGTTATARAVVRILADVLTDRLTLIGRVTDGGCSAQTVHNGIAGVRVMLEDGSYAITDKDGRYHFDSLVPGDHVAQVMKSTLPAGGHFLDCARSTRTAGSEISRFVSGQGGMLAVADFYAELPVKSVMVGPGKLAPSADAPHGEVAPDGNAGPADDSAVQHSRLTDRAAAGGNIEWLRLGDGPPAFLFPAADHNPRSPAIRVVIRHRADQKIEMSANGKPVAPLTFDGMKTPADHSYAISVWSGIPLDGDNTQFVAIVRNADGSVATKLTRDVHFSHVAAEAQLVPEQTHLVADGSTRPVIALRILDRNGRPVHAGLAGDLAISSPYESADNVADTQTRSLAHIGQATPHWSVKGDDGIAYIELAPTMVSGAVHFDFIFGDGEQKRRQTIDNWVVPGDIPWTLVGLAEGSIGSRSIADVMERTGSFDSDLGSHARTAFYAKGRILGHFLLTVAYDSAKQSADQTLLGTINPNAYYTVFADGSARHFDAASRSKLYVRIESRAFQAMFGDYQTGLNQTQLARYQRTLTGVKAEVNLGHLHVQGFGARTSTSHRHLEIQGGGLTGPYALGGDAVIANSETVAIQVRDRFRSEDIVSSTVLTRFIDYDIDLLSGSLTFKQPVLSHDASLDPQFIIVDYDVDPTMALANSVVGGGRIDWTGANGHLRVGATGISDVGSNTTAVGATGGTARTSLSAVDIKAQITKENELRVEAAQSRTSGVAANAWLVEAEHHDKHVDMLAYVHSVDAAFGLGDVGNAELGWRKYGVDVKMRTTKNLSIIATGWIDKSLTDASTQEAAQVKAEYHLDRTTLHLGVNTMIEHAGGSDEIPTNSGSSTVLIAGVSRKFLNDRLQIDASGSLGIGQTTAIDQAATDAITARYALNSHVKLVASYEVANSNALETHTARAGFELQPWQGSKMAASIGDQLVDEYGARSFAAFGLAQSWQVNKHLIIDGSVDANKVLSGFDASKIPNLAQPVVNGGQLNGSGTLTENFTALTLGASWKQGLWTATLRGEYRAGEFADRHGLTFGAIRQLGDGTIVGAGLAITRASGSDGSMSAVTDSSIAFARRPASSDFAVLGKLEYRSDTVVAATTTTGTSALSASTIAGVAGTAESTALTVNGNARSRRVIVSFSGDWSPTGRDGDDLVQRSELGLFLAARYNFDAYDGYNLAGSTLLAGLDLHIGIGARFEIGSSITVRADISDNTSSYSVGPNFGFVPAKNVLLIIGYNFSGFRDPDFTANRFTNRGLFASLKMKLDTSTLGFLGLDAHPR